MTEDATPGPVTADRSKKMPRWLFCLRASWIICLMPVVFLAAASVMMIERDITAPSWIAARIEARAADVMDGAKLDFGQISLQIGRDLHPRVRLIDTRLVDAGGLTLTRVPMVEGLISPRGLIFQQDLLFQEVRLIGAQINLRRAVNGDVSFAFSAAGGALRQARSLPELLDQFDQIFERPALEALEIVRAEGLIVNFDDARAGRSWIVDGGTVSLDLRGGQTAIRGNFGLLSGRAAVTGVTLSYASARGSRAAQIGLNITDAVASDLAAQSPALSWLRDVEAPISAAIRTSLDAEGALGPMNATLEIGAGVLQPNPATQPVAFEAAKAYFTFDPVRDRISFSEISLQTEWGSLQAEGDAYLREFRDGLPRALLAQFQFRDVAINPPGFFDVPPQVPLAAVDLRLRLDPFSVEIGQLVAIDGPTRLQASGALTATDRGWSVALDSRINQITPEKISTFWPLPIRPGTRAWFEDNVSGGQLVNVVAGLRRTPDQPDQVAVGFGFADTTIQFLRHVPPVNGAAGVASIIDHRFHVSLDAGVVTAPQGGPMQMAGTHFEMVDLRLRPLPAILDLRIDSSITAALSVMNQPPFEYLDKANLPVTIADGRARTQARISWPLQPRPPQGSVSFDVRSDLSRVRSETLVPGRTLASPALRATVNAEGITIEGPVRLGEVQATGSWQQQFRNPSRPGSRVQAEVALSPRFLDEFGIALPPGTIAGAGTAAVSVDLQRGAAPRFALASDLRGITVAIPAVGWSKGPQTAGNLAIEGSLGPVPAIDSLLVEGGGLRAEGQISLTAAGQLDAARFSSVRLGDWLNAPITLRGRGQGQPVGVEIGGGTLDLRRARFGAGQGDSGPISIALDRLQITEGIALTGFRGNFRGEGGFRGEFSGQMNGAAGVQGAVAPRDGRSAVRLRSDDAGGVLAAAGFMRNAVGGVLDLTLLPALGAGTFDGSLAVRGLRVRDAPTVAALLDAISVVGLLQQMDGQGLAFDEVDVRFRLTPVQVIVSEASAVGPGLGISVDGLYTLASKQIDLQGVVSPFYLVNSIGAFLTRKGEGLIGFNFNIGGTSDAPQVSVNPLSALTPGMFREIFRRPAPDLTQ